MIDPATITWHELAAAQERDAWQRFNLSGSADAGAWSAIQFWREQKRLAKTAPRIAPEPTAAAPAAPSSGGYSPPLNPPAPVSPGPDGAAVTIPKATAAQPFPGFHVEEIKTPQERAQRLPGLSLPEMPRRAQIAPRAAPPQADIAF